ncbi:filamentous hemagglutinin N-terminal domain-containing protein, partial [Dyella sp.]|uniref:filamentous hemagglutinin N-terminal domain-containing protein n=1 Tax=Dyella sp. TaxID=1869338 RepID=UPI002ED52936
MIKPLRSTSGNKAPGAPRPKPPMHRRPLAQWIATALAMGAMQAHAGAPPLSQAWLASQRQGAMAGNTQAGTPGSAGIPGLSPQTAAQLQQQKSVQQSLANLNSAAQAVAAQISAQRTAQQAAQAQSGSPVPDGIAAGGLQVAAGLANNPSLWQNANQPTQSANNGQTTVEIKQTAQKAILTWDSFNVGRHTTLHFDQTGGTQTDGSNNWIALNRINDPSSRPSQILGQIKAEGTVYLINRNGILFGAGSQVNTHSLLATSMNLFSNDVSASNAFFLQNGISQTQDPNHILDPSQTLVPLLVGGATKDGSGNLALSGGITVEKGASIQTQAQGFTLIAAPHIVQSGSITSDDGTAILASADALQYVAPASGSGAAFSVSRSPLGLGSLQGWTGSIENDGLIQARRGNIQMYGATVEQNGVLVASTSLNKAGRISLGGGSDFIGIPTRIELGEGSVTTILPEKDGETTTSSQDADQAFQTSSINLSATDSILLDRNALVEVPSGNVSMSVIKGIVGQAATRIYLDQGAIIDVSGLADVELPMAALLVSIPRVGQNELADSPLLRNSFLYTQKNVVIDSTQSGVRADGLDWVGSPVLNASGYVENIPRSIDELMLKGGTISLVADQVITRSGSQLRADGGYLNYLPGWIQTPNLLGADGRIYNIADADPNIDYVGFAGQYADNHARWGVSDVYSNPLLAGLPRYDNGFIQGADAGSINIGGLVSNGVSVEGIAILDGDLSARAYAGRNQVAQGMAPLGGSLSVSSGDPLNGPLNASPINYRLVDTVAPIESTNPLFDGQTPLGDPDAPGSPQTTWYLLPSELINRGGFSKFKLATVGDIEDDANRLTVHPGGEIDLLGAGVVVASGSTIQVSSGAINLTGINATGIGGQLLAQDGIVIGAGATLDARGLWVNDSGLTEDSLVGTQYINGGSINLSTTLGSAYASDISLAAGSVLDVSSGGYVQRNGLVAVSDDVPLGQGGNITLATHVSALNVPQTPGDLSGGKISMDGSLLGYGFTGGGTLSIAASQIQIGGEQPADDPTVSLLYLPAAFFSGQGFGHYQLVAAGSAVIADNATVVVKPANLLPDYAVLAAAPTGSNVYASGLTTIGFLDDYHRWQGGAAGTQSAGFSLQAGQAAKWFTLGTGPAYLQSDTLVLGRGASVQVDPGATVSLQATGSVDIFGSVMAHGGDIDLESTTATGGFLAPQRNLWLGPDSVLDASGISLINPSATVSGSLSGGFIPRTGQVLDGGQVNLVADKYLLAQSGALIDVSGASDTYDLPVAQATLGGSIPGVAATPVWSNAGSIDLAAAGGMLFDASYQAHAGAAQGRGGSLAVRALNESLNPSTNQTTAVAIVLQQSGDLLPGGYQPGDAIAPSDTPSGLGVLHFTVDRLKGSGIADFTVGPDVGDLDSQNRYAPVPVIFAGNVSLNLDRSVVFNTSALMAGSSSAQIPVQDGSQITGAGTVSISAPYVYLADGGTATTPLAAAGDGNLEVQGQFIDIGGRLSLAGFAQAGFHSQGDLRFYLPAVDAFDGKGVALTGWLFSSGDMDFSAKRIYSASDYGFLLDAAPQQAGQTSTIRFENSGNSDSSTPLSAGGALSVAASQIEQGGTLWLPSGNIVLGVGDVTAERTALGLPGTFVLPATDRVDLLPGSVTSVSLNGAVLPYGSTVDGQEWRYDAAPGVTGQDLTAPPVKQISVNGNQVSLQQGAKVDVSGGGDLQAFEWIPGSGGSRDVLLQSQVSYTTSTTGSQQSLYPDNRAVYAVIPGYAAPVAAHDFALEKGAGAGPAVGQAVYLSGVPGLPPGIYTLLPARYATLKGAFRVVQNTGSQDAVLGSNAAQPDGTQVVSGYFVDALTGARDARTTTFDVQSMAVWQQYSQYTETPASQFFAAQAAHAGAVAPPLPQDAGHLILAASQQLELGATLTAGMGAGGRGAEVDIAGQSIQILGSGEQARAGYLTIDASGLTTLGASSLLIGGTRSAGADGDVLNVQASSIVLSNDAAHPLSAPEVILAANGAGLGIEVDTGSVLRGAGDTTGLDGTPLVIGQLASDGVPAVSGDGALLRVSSGSIGSVVRHDVTGIDGAAGTATGNLVIGDGVTIDGGNALSLDATGKTQVDTDALLGASHIDVTANRIAFIGAAAQGDDNGFLVGDATLHQFDQAQSVTLRSRGTLDFIGDVDVNLDHDLVLDAGAVTSDGGAVSIHTAKLTLSNDTGSASVFAAGSGQLAIQADELDFGDGAWTLRGFGGVTVAANQGIVAQGHGTFDFGQLDIRAQTPRVIAATGANTTVETAGALSFTALAGTPLSVQSAGGTLNLSGDSVLLDTDIEAPAGKLAVTASTGDIDIGSHATLGVVGVTRNFNDVQSHLPGGTLILDAAGDVQVDSQATLDIAGDAQGGNAGQLDITAGGLANLAGHLLGSAASGYFGGNLDLNTNGAVDLAALSDALASSGINGSLTVRSGTGDLDLDAGHALTAHLITLTADGDPAAGGGWVRIDGTLDASGTFGGPITLYGKAGVDVQGALLSFATAPGRKGGNIELGTDGVADGTYNASYGYENVQPGDSGAIVIGSHAVLNMNGDGGRGSLLLRAPLLTTGDVNVTVSDGAQLLGADQVVLEAYATWSTDDQQDNMAQHFDGIVDPAGWYGVDPATGKVALVSGTFTDASGQAVAAPDPSNAAQIAQYMSEYVFTPDTGAAITDHQTFYGYVDGDPSKGAGTLMGFVENAGVDAGSRFATIPNFHVRPGINLVNPDTNINQGDISILTNWNLGAGSQNADGSLNLVYRYGDQAPILSLRAERNLDVRASITDGFFQSSNVVAGAAAPEADWEDAWNAYQDLRSSFINNVFDTPEDLPDVIFAPTEFTGPETTAMRQYYEQY